MLFKLTNKNSDRMTHCGVLEFVADEGICYLPHWVSLLPAQTRAVHMLYSADNAVIVRTVTWRCKWERNTWAQTEP